MIYCRSQADVDSFPFVSTHNRHHLWRLSIPAKAIRWMLRCSNVVDTIHIVRHTYRFRWSSQTLLSPKQRQWEVQQTIDAIIRAKQSAANLWTASFSQSKLNVIFIKRNLRISVAVADRLWYHYWFLPKVFDGDKNRMIFLLEMQCFVDPACQLVVRRM